MKGGAGFRIDYEKRLGFPRQMGASRGLYRHARFRYLEARKVYKDRLLALSRPKMDRAVQADQRLTLPTSSGSPGTRACAASHIARPEARIAVRHCLRQRLC